MSMSADVWRFNPLQYFLGSRKPNTQAPSPMNQLILGHDRPSANQIINSGDRQKGHKLPARSNTPHLQKQRWGGFTNGDFLMGGLSMLAGRNFQDGVANLAGVAGDALARNRRAAEEEQNRTALMRAMMQTDPKKQREAMVALSPEDRGFMYGVSRDRIADNRYETEYADRRADRQSDVDWRTSRADAHDSQWAAGYDQRETEANRAQQRWQKSYDRDVYESDRGHGLAEDQLALQRDKLEQSRSAAVGWRPASPQEISDYGYDPETTTAQVGPKGEFKIVREQKPFISSESMARVASNLPNLQAASKNLNELFTTKQGSGLTGVFAPDKGYRPGHDWGAQAISGIPDWGLLEGAAKLIGGEDYQTYETEYAAFEAAALPIVSGSAVSESEGKRFLKSIKVQMGDNDQIVARKLQAKENFVRGLEAAARGDSTMLQELIGGSKDVETGNSAQPLAAQYSSPEEALRANPNPYMIQMYEAKYGPGSAARVLGGR